MINPSLIYLNKNAILSAYPFYQYINSKQNNTIYT